MYESWLEEDYENWLGEEIEKTEKQEQKEEERERTWNDYYSYVTLVKLSDRKLIYRILCLIRDLGAINFKKLKKMLGWKYARIVQIMEEYELVINDFGRYRRSYKSTVFIDYLAKATLKIKER